ncbi:amino acid ABC transporter permease [Nocardioides jiangxiensis]|uniref:Amino acid ABC transporter permease n=1 Tax=Nocardioides jiangxiensis TaxID=3064524 RepID=A0ABT9B5U8_9ACTN|nr:amino acid ABC transporter permease [Nocardioides sp. WY-20]MDO7868982.1 amino acid ABC transporter permease [Nocardioides sp. WY-20]
MPALTRRQRRAATHLGVYAVLALLVLLLVLKADWEALKLNFADGDTWRGQWPDIFLIGAKNTLFYTVIAFAGGLALALVLALMKMSSVLGLRWIAIAWIEFFRGLPALVVILFMAFGVPLAFDWNAPGGTIGAGLIGLVFVASAYMAETLRAGIQAVPKGQTEAARSLGMSSYRTTTSIVLPQALRVVIPPLTNEGVLLLKDTSLLAFVGAQASQVDLTAYGQQGIIEYANSAPLLAIALVYLAISLPLTQLVAALERRQQRAR